LYLDNINISEITGAGINQITADGHVTLQPNPVADILTIQYDKNVLGENITVSIYDTNGKLILEQNAANGNIEMDLLSMNSGMYVAKISKGGVFHSAHKFTKL
jgi:hypothetical protein